MYINSLIKKLKLNGFKINSFSETSLGNYDKLDSDWNYKDVPHLKHIHKLVDPIHINIGKKYSSTIALQRIFFIQIPLPIFIFEEKPFSLIYYTVFGPYVIFVHTDIKQEYNVTSTVTTYYICSINFFFSIFSPFIKFLLLRNYKILMSDDIPMRERRGYLRSLGYNFLMNGNTYNFDETSDVSKFNVILNPSSVDSFFYYAENFKDKICGGHLRTYIGDSDYYGIFFLINNNKISFYQRICLHEGACLDFAISNKANLTCPWHGKSIKPIFTSTINDVYVFRRDKMEYEVNVEKKICKISFFD